MEYVVKHGHRIETATPDEVREIIRTEQQQQSEEHRREKGVIDLNAAGAGKRVFNTPRSYNWIMERATIGGPGAVNALVVLIANDSGSDLDMLEVIQLGTAGRYSDSFSNYLWIPAGDSVAVIATGGVANLQITYNFQVKMLPVPA